MSLSASRITDNMARITFLNKDDDEKREEKEEGEKEKEISSNKVIP